jgi:REP element-mobilizing transposase RayT
MPRKARITVPGAVHHVMSRGIEGRSIFRDDNDRSAYLRILQSSILKSGYRLYAWVLMDNHYHLVMRISEYPLGVFMRNVNGQYAQHFRKSAASRGYLFQDRYKSIVTQDQNYIEQLVRYVHLNPLRAGQCADLSSLDHYRWCGHATLMGNQVCSFQNTRDVLARFGSTHNQAVKKYRDFIGVGIGTEGGLAEIVRKANAETENIHLTGCWVIGNKEFVRKAIERDRLRRVRIADYAKQDIHIGDIAQKVAKYYGLPFEALGRRGKSNDRSAARKAVAYIASQRYGIPVIEIARYFNISSPSVSEMLREGAEPAKGIS